MNILRQKLDIKPGLPKDLMQQTEMWAPIHLELSSTMSGILPRQYLPDGIETEFYEFSELLKILPGDGVYLGFGRNESPSMCFASFGIQQASAVTAHSLGLPSNGDIEDYKPSRLDALLFKPVIQALEGEIRSLMSNIDVGDENGLACRKQELNLKHLNIPFNTESWCAISFYMRVQEDLSDDDTKKLKAKQAGTPKSKKAESSELQDRWSFKFVLPVTMLQRLAAASGCHHEPPIIDPLDPWTGHMRNSIDRAIVPIRAVVETCRMTVAECTRFEIGQVINLPGVSLQSIGLETELGRGKAPFAPAALGIYKSHRAVKLTEDLDPAFMPAAGLI